VAALAHFCQRPLAYIIVPENLRPEGGGSEIDSAASAGRKTHREKKLSGRQKSAREIPSQRGEIVAIVITIELGFIRIIISSPSSLAPSSSPHHPVVTSWVESCPILRGNFLGVDYSCS
jgi:hypothetical protein